MKGFFVIFFFYYASCVAQGVIFHETFADTLFNTRGWYDGRISITTAEHPPRATHSAEYHFKKGSSTGIAGSGIRHLIPPTDSVYLRYQVKYSANWVGSLLPYHPHEFSFLTNEDNSYIGPADTHLTTYIEENNGRPQLSIQDGLNIDESHIGVERTHISEQRAVSGCNGSGDPYPAGDCYLYDTTHHLNGKTWKAPRPTFTDTAGSYFKNDWHTVEAVFKLNSIVGGIGLPDGVIQYWFDGVPLIDDHDVLMRTGVHATMQFNQFFVGPYIGGSTSNPGSPIDQTVWYGDLTVATGRTPDSATAVFSDNDVTPGELSITGYPDPVHTGEDIVFSVTGANGGDVRVMDILGREIWHTSLNQGEHHAEFDTHTIPAGAYWCVVQSGGHRAGKMVHIVR